MDIIYISLSPAPRQKPSRPSPIPSRVASPIPSRFASPIPSRSASPSQQLTYTRDQLMRLRDTQLSRAVPKDLPRTTEYTWGIDLFVSTRCSVKKVCRALQNAFFPLNYLLRVTIVLGFLLLKIIPLFLNRNNLLN